MPGRWKDTGKTQEKHAGETRKRMSTIRRMDGKAEPRAGREKRTKTNGGKTPGGTWKGNFLFLASNRFLKTSIRS